jgi:hypothetical protein
MCERDPMIQCRISRFYDGCPGEVCGQLKTNADAQRLTHYGPSYADHLAAQAQPRESTLKRETDRWPGKPP